MNWKPLEVVVAGAVKPFSVLYTNAGSNNDGAGCVEDATVERCVVHGSPSADNDSRHAAKTLRQAKRRNM